MDEEGDVCGEREGRADSNRNRDAERGGLGRRERWEGCEVKRGEVRRGEEMVGGEQGENVGERYGDGLDGRAVGQ